MQGVWVPFCQHLSLQLPQWPDLAVNQLLTPPPTGDLQIMTAWGDGSDIHASCPSAGARGRSVTGSPSMGEWATPA